MEAVSTKCDILAQQLEKVVSERNDLERLNVRQHAALPGYLNAALPNYFALRCQTTSIRGLLVVTLLTRRRFLEARYLII